MAQGVSQVHGGSLSIAKVDRVGLNSQEHALDPLAPGGVVSWRSLLMVCDPIPRLVVSNTYRCGTSPVHERLQGDLSRSAYSEFLVRQRMAWIRNGWPSCSRTALSPLSEVSHCRVEHFVEPKYLRTGALVTSCFTCWTVLSWIKDGPEPSYVRECPNC